MRQRPFPAMAAAAAILSLGVGGMAAAQEGHRTLGLSITVLNDDIPGGAIEDRWRSGGLDVALVRGTGWTGAPAVRFGDVLVWQFRGEVITPEDLDNPAPGDRPYAGALSFGVHSHMRHGGNEFRLGADILFTGPQTGLSDLQAGLHERQDLPDPKTAADDQIGDATYLVASGEWARPVPLGRAVSLRPFASVRAGDETFARIGVDLVGGALASDGLLLREVVTGQLTEGTRGGATGFGWSAGLDLAAVADSVYLPDEDGLPGPQDTRGRARIGALWAGQGWSVFFGTAYLGEEFDGQDEGQILGSLALTVSF